MLRTVAAIVIILVLAELARTAVQICRDPQHRREYSETVRALRWWMIPAGVVHLVAVGATAVLLQSLVPPLRYGWWSLIGGSGNVLIGQTSYNGTLWRLVGIVLPLTLVVLIPWLAHLEESAFRAGSENCSIPRRLRTQLSFGLIHCVVGVPLAVGIALTISGLYYERVYLTALSRRRNAITATMDIPSPARVPYPAAPSGPGYDPAAWDAHMALSDDVALKNKEIVETWAVNLHVQVESATIKARALKQEAVTIAAAAHAASNWLVLFVFFLLSLASFLR